MTNINNNNQSFYLQQQRLKQAQAKKLEDDAEKEKELTSEQNKAEEEKEEQPKQPFEERGDVLANTQDLIAMQALNTLNINVTSPNSKVTETPQVIQDEVQEDEQISETEQQTNVQLSTEPSNSSTAIPQYSNIENKIICDYLELTTDKDFSNITLNSQNLITSFNIDEIEYKIDYSGDNIKKITGKNGTIQTINIECTYNSSGKINSSIVTKYNENGKKSEEITKEYRALGGLSSETVIIYDNGKQTEKTETTFYPNGSKTIKTYNDKNKLISTETIEPQEFEQIDATQYIARSAQGVKPIKTTDGEVITGDANNNTLTGSAGNDTIMGGSGDDFIMAALGNDSINAGSGNNIISFYKGHGDDTIVSAEGGNDTLFLPDSAFGEVSFVLGTGNDKNLYIYYGDNDKITVEGYQNGNHSVKHFTFGVGQLYYDDINYLINREISAKTNNGEIIDGGAGDDTITGGIGDDIIMAAQGNDKINAGAGNNIITFYKGHGDDTIVSAEGGNDTLFLPECALGEVSFVLGTGNDKNLYIYYGDNDKITVEGYQNGNHSVKHFTFGVGQIYYDDINYLINRELSAKTNKNERVDGGAGNDTITGKAGNDTIMAAQGNDVINGGAGDNTLLFYKGHGSDTVVSGGGNDNLSLPDSKFNEIQLNKVNEDLIINYGNNDQITVKDYQAGNHSVKTLTVEGKTYRIEDILNKATFTFGGRKDGSFGNDSIVGFDSNDTIMGSIGDDTINAGGGYNVLEFWKGHGQDIIENGGGVDTILLGNSAIYEVSVSKNETNNDLIITYGNGDIITVKDYFAGNHSVKNIVIQGITYSMEEFAKGIITGTNATDNIMGTAGNDIINGLNGDDIIMAAQGNDKINAGAGNNIITFYKGHGDDTIVSAEGGNDTLFLPDCALGEVSFVLGTGNDKNLYIYYGDNDKITVEGYQNGNHSVKHFTFGVGQIYYDDINYLINRELSAKTNKNERVDGGAGNDTITGRAGNDTIMGAQGNDIINGGAGDNTLLFFKGHGNDTVISGGGSDVISLPDSTRNEVKVVLGTENDKNLYINYGNGDKITVENYKDNTDSIKQFVIGNTTYGIEDFVELPKTEQTQNIENKKAENKQILSDILHFDNNTVFSNEQFDENQNLTSFAIGETDYKISYNNSGNVTTITAKNGNTLTESITRAYTTEGILLNEMVRTYNSNSVETEFTIKNFNENGTISSQTSHYYDNDSNEIKEVKTKYNSEGNISEETETEFDSDGFVSLVTVTTYNSDGTQTVKKLDTNGEEISDNNENIENSDNTLKENSEETAQTQDVQQEQQPVAQTSDKTISSTNFTNAAAEEGTNATDTTTTSADAATSSTESTTATGTDTNGTVTTDTTTTETTAPDITTGTPPVSSTPTEAQTTDTTPAGTQTSTDTNNTQWSENQINEYLQKRDELRAKVDELYEKRFDSPSALQQWQAAERELQEFYAKYPGIEDQIEKMDSQNTSSQLNYMVDDRGYTHNYEYDSNGLVIKETVYNKDKELYSIYTSDDNVENTTYYKTYNGHSFKVQEYNTEWMEDGSLVEDYFEAQDISELLKALKKEDASNSEIQKLLEQYPYNSYTTILSEDLSESYVTKWTDILYSNNDVPYGVKTTDYNSATEETVVTTEKIYTNATYNTVEYYDIAGLTKVVEENKGSYSSIVTTLYDNYGNYQKITHYPNNSNYNDYISIYDKNGTSLFSYSVDRGINPDKIHFNSDEKGNISIEIGNNYYKQEIDDATGTVTVTRPTITNGTITGKTETITNKDGSYIETTYKLINNEYKLTSEKEYDIQGKVTSSTTNSYSSYLDETTNQQVSILCSSKTYLYSNEKQYFSSESSFYDNGILKNKTETGKINNIPYKYNYTCSALGNIREWTIINPGTSQSKTISEKEYTLDENNNQIFKTNYNYQLNADGTTNTYTKNTYSNGVLTQTNVYQYEYDSDKNVTKMTTTIYFPFSDESQTENASEEELQANARITTYTEELINGEMTVTSSKVGDKILVESDRNEDGTIKEIRQYNYSVSRGSKLTYTTYPDLGYKTCCTKITPNLDGSSIETSTGYDSSGIPKTQTTIKRYPSGETRTLEAIYYNENYTDETPNLEISWENGYNSKTTFDENGNITSRIQCGTNNYTQIEKQKYDENGKRMSYTCTVTNGAASTYGHELGTTYNSSQEITFDKNGNKLTEISTTEYSDGEKTTRTDTYKDGVLIESEIFTRDIGRNYDNNTGEYLPTSATDTTEHYTYNEYGAETYHSKEEIKYNKNIVDSEYFGYGKSFESIETNTDTGVKTKTHKSFSVSSFGDSLNIDNYEDYTEVIKPDETKIYNGTTLGTYWLTELTGIPVIVEYKNQITDSLNNTTWDSCELYQPEERQVRSNRMYTVGNECLYDDEGKYTDWYYDYSHTLQSKDFAISGDTLQDKTENISAGADSIMSQLLGALKVELYQESSCQKSGENLIQDCKRYGKYVSASYTQEEFEKDCEEADRYGYSGPIQHSYTENNERKCISYGNYLFCSEYSRTYSDPVQIPGATRVEKEYTLVPINLTEDDGEVWVDYEQVEITKEIPTIRIKQSSVTHYIGKTELKTGEEKAWIEKTYNSDGGYTQIEYTDSTKMKKSKETTVSYSGSQRTTNYVYYADDSTRTTTSVYDYKYDKTFTSEIYEYNDGRTKWNKNYINEDGNVVKDEYSNFSGYNLSPHRYVDIKTIKGDLIESTHEEGNFDIENNTFDKITHKTLNQDGNIEETYYEYDQVVIENTDENSSENTTERILAYVRKNIYTPSGDILKKTTENYKISINTGTSRKPVYENTYYDYPINTVTKYYSEEGYDNYYWTEFDRQYRNDRYEYSGDIITETTSIDPETGFATKITTLNDDMIDYDWYNINDIQATEETTKPNPVVETEATPTDITFCTLTSYANIEIDKILNTIMQAAGKNNLEDCTDYVESNSETGEITFRNSAVQDVYDKLIRLRNATSSLSQSIDINDENYIEHLKEAIDAYKALTGKTTVNFSETMTKFGELESKEADIKTLSIDYQVAYELNNFFARANKTSYTEEDKKAIDDYYAKFTGEYISNIVDKYPREEYLSSINQIINNFKDQLIYEFPENNFELEGKSISEISTLLEKTLENTKKEYNTTYSSVFGNEITDAVKQIQLTQSYLTETDALFKYMNKDIMQTLKNEAAGLPGLGAVGLAVDYISELLGASCFTLTDEQYTNLCTLKTDMKKVIAENPNGFQEFYQEHFYRYGEPVTLTVNTTQFEKLKQMAKEGKVKITFTDTANYMGTQYKITYQTKLPCSFDAQDLQDFVTLADEYERIVSLDNFTNILQKEADKLKNITSNIERDYSVSLEQLLITNDSNSSVLNTISNIFINNIEKSVAKLMNNDEEKITKYLDSLVEQYSDNHQSWDNWKDFEKNATNKQIIDFCKGAYLGFQGEADNNKTQLDELSKQFAEKYKLSNTKLSTFEELFKKKSSDVFGDSTINGFADAVTSAIKTRAYGTMALNVAAGLAVAGVTAGLGGNAFLIALTAGGKTFGLDVIQSYTSVDGLKDGWGTALKNATKDAALTSLCTMTGMAANGLHNAITDALKQGGMNAVSAWIIGDVAEILADGASSFLLSSMFGEQDDILEEWKQSAIEEITGPFFSCVTGGVANCIKNLRIKNLTNAALKDGVKLEDLQDSYKALIDYNTNKKGANKGELLERIAKCWQCEGLKNKTVKGTEIDNYMKIIEQISDTRTINAIAQCPNILKNESLDIDSLVKMINSEGFIPEKLVVADMIYEKSFEVSLKFGENEFSMQKPNITKDSLEKTVYEFGKSATEDIMSGIKTKEDAQIAIKLISEGKYSSDNIARIMQSDEIKDYLKNNPDASKSKILTIFAEMFPKVEKLQVTHHTYTIKDVVDSKVTDVISEYKNNSDFKEKIDSQCEPGDAININGKLYCNNGEELVELNLSKEKFTELFLKKDIFDIQQGAIADCYLVAQLISIVESPKLRTEMYKSFYELENGDVSVKLGGYDFVFKDGKLEKNSIISLKDIQRDIREGSRSAKFLFPILTPTLILPLSNFTKSMTEALEFAPIVSILGIVSLSVVMGPLIRGISKKHLIGNTGYQMLEQSYARLKNNNKTNLSEAFVNLEYGDSAEVLKTMYPDQQVELAYTSETSLKSFLKEYADGDKIKNNAVVLGTKVYNPINAFMKNITDGTYNIFSEYIGQYIGLPGYSAAPLAPQHCYTVYAYNDETGIVTLRRGNNKPFEISVYDLEKYIDDMGGVKSINKTNSK